MGELTVPVELKALFDSHPEARAVFEALPPSHRKEHVGYIAGAKKQETRERRARRTVERLLGGN